MFNRQLFLETKLSNVKKISKIVMIKDRISAKIIFIVGIERKCFRKTCILEFVKSVTSEKSKLIIFEKAIQVIGKTLDL
jgi:hypothetical protein